MRTLYRTARSALAILGLLWVIVTVTPVTSRYAAVLMGPWGTPAGGTMIVLGADGPTDGVIGLASYWRACYAVWAWRRGGFQEVVVSGGNGIADSMKAFMVSQGIPADKIVTETRSTSTRENALFTAAIVRGMPDPKVLLTSDYHVYRSIRAFRRAGMEVTSLPFPYGIKRSNKWLDRWPVFQELCLESGKILYYKAKGWI